MRLDEALIRRIGEQLGEEIAKLVGRSLTRDVTVLRVDDTHAEVVLFEGDAPIRVPLRPLSIGESVVVVKPVVGSTAVIGYVDGNLSTPFFVAFGEVENVSVQVGASTIEIADGTIKLNGGELGGLARVSALTARLNAIENDINNLKDFLSLWTPAPGDGGAALKIATKFWYGDRLTPTKDADYENTKILQ